MPPLHHRPHEGPPLLGRKRAQSRGDSLGGAQLCFGALCPVLGYPAPFWGMQTYLGGGTELRFGALSMISGQHRLVLGPGQGQLRAGSPPGLRKEQRHRRG